MYKVYAFATPNSVKVPIALEELGLPYELVGINVRKGEQKTPEYLAINPNGKVPALVDLTAPAPRRSLMESAAILVYLAEKHGRLLPPGGMARARVFEQLFFHASAISPAFGQAGFFAKLAPEKLPLAIERFHGEANRLLQLLDRILQSDEYVAGNEYTIADIAHFGWMWRRAFANVDFDATPNVARWYETVSRRDATIAAIAKVEALLPPA